MQWISQHSEALLVLINFAILLVWAFYAQLLYNGYRRSRRPKIIINQGVGSGLGSICLLANMSTEGVFVQVVVVSLFNDNDRITRVITDLPVHLKENDEETTGSVKLQQQTLQGPLSPNQYIPIGTFRRILEAVLARPEDESADQDADRYYLELMVVATYGSESKPIGAKRVFEFGRTQDGDRWARPATLDTQRMAGLRDRRRMAQVLRHHL